MAFRDTLGLLTKHFEEFVSTKTVIGEPMVLGEVTLIPIVALTCGIGGGGGEGSVAEREKSDVGGSGEGVGGGFRITPVAIVSIKGDEVKILPVTKKGSMFEKLFESLPQLIEKAAGQIKHKQGAKKEDQDDGEDEDE